MPPAQPTFFIDGNDFSDEASFYDHFRSQFIWVNYFGETLNGWGELLLSGFNTGHKSYRLVWLNHEKSSKELAANGFWEEILELLDEYGEFIELELR